MFSKTDYLIITMFVVIAVLPLVAVIVRGISPHLAGVLAWPAFWRALTASLCVGLASGGLATLLAFIMATARTRRKRAGRSVRWLDVAVSLYLAVTAIVLGTGLLILLRPEANILTLAPALVLLANILVALPFA